MPGTFFMYAGAAVDSGHYFFKGRYLEIIKKIG